MEATGDIGIQLENHSSIPPPPVQEVKARFLNTFYFSQGSPGLQSSIDEYLALLEPGPWNVSDEYLKELRDQSLQAVARYVNFNTKGGYTHSGNVGSQEALKASATSIRGEKGEYDRLMEVNMTLGTFMDFMTGKRAVTKSSSELVESIAEQMLARDNKYIHRGVIFKGRPRRKESFTHRIRRIGKPQPTDRYNPRMDRFLSMVCYYGLGGNTTNDPNYDRLFSEIAAYFRGEGQTKLDREVETGEVDQADQPKTENGLEMLNAVIQTYNQRHPQAQVSL